MPTVLEQESIDIRDAADNLAVKKDRLLITGKEIPETLDYRFLRLMLRIIEYDNTNRALLTSKQRRNNLGNLVITAKLLTDRIKKHYDSTTSGFEGYNVWRDLVFLLKFDFEMHVGVTTPIYTISNDCVINLLKNVIHQHFRPIIEAEIKAIQPHYHRGDLVLFGHRNWINDHATLREHYKNNKLMDLYLIVTPKRELEQIKKAITAIQHIEAAEISPPLTLEQIKISKRGILHNLMIIGESVTKKNLSPQTSALVYREFEANTLRQTLIILANKITHSEWDIHRRTIEGCIEAFDFTSIKAIVPRLLAIFTIMCEQLKRLEADDNLGNHYSNPPVIPSDAAAPTFDSLVQLRNQLKGTDKIAKDDRLSNPESFTTLAMYNRIVEEVQLLNHIVLDLRGHECLKDDSLFKVDFLVSITTWQPWVTTLANVEGQAAATQIDDAWQKVTEHATKASCKLTLDIPKYLCPVYITDTGIDSVQHRSFSDADVKQHLCLHHEGFVQALFTQAIRCQFFSSLIDNPSAMHAAYFHMSRIEKFIQEIDKAELEPLLGRMKLEECRTFRNFTRHGNDAQDIYPVKPHMFLARYIAFVQRLPRLLQPLAIHDSHITIDLETVIFNSLLTAKKVSHGFFSSQPPRNLREINDELEKIKCKEYTMEEMENGVKNIIKIAQRSGNQYPILRAAQKLQNLLQKYKGSTQSCPSPKFY